ncbi:MAG: DJ-1/PfpI family protein [Bacteroidales bacterium]|nr:DJ-1/PfpI family protein [Bacteroidales bacterium]
MKKVLLFLAQGFEAFEAAAFTDVFGWTKYSNEFVKLETTSLRTELKCTWSLIVKPEIPFSEKMFENYDALAIPGGFESAGFYEDAFDERFLQLIRKFDEQKKPIAAICVGALPVAKSGVLKNRNATTYDLDEGKWRKKLSDLGANVKNKSLVVDKNIITSTGPVTSLDVAFELLEMLTNKKNVETVKKLMRITN